MHIHCVSAALRALGARTYLRPSCVFLCRSRTFSSVVPFFATGWEVPPFLQPTPGLALSLENLRGIFSGALLLHRFPHAVIYPMTKRGGSPFPVLAQIHRLSSMQRSTAGQERSRQICAQKAPPCFRLVHRHLCWTFLRSGVAFRASFRLERAAGLRGGMPTK